jgi:hypothetical protein
MEQVLFLACCSPKKRLEFGNQKGKKERQRLYTWLAVNAKHGDSSSNSFALEIS